jgi:hypothetical protein
MYISTLNKNKPQGIDNSTIVQVVTPRIKTFDQHRFLLAPLDILSSLANPWTHGSFELKAKACEQ